MVLDPDWCDGWRLADRVVGPDGGASCGDGFGVLAWLFDERSFFAG